MEQMSMLFSNYVLNVAIISWSSAQVAKTIIYYIINKKFSPERLVGAGGMPSCHSATVCGTTMALARYLGYNSPIFALSLIFAMVVMYDAMGVRRQAGEHARTLNIFIQKFKEQDNNISLKDFKIKKGKLKEYLGHTPLEVLVGALLGIVIAMLLPI